MSAILVIAGLFGQAELSEEQISSYLTAVSRGYDAEAAEWARQREIIKEEEIPPKPASIKKSASTKDRAAYHEAMKIWRKAIEEKQARIAVYDAKIADAYKNPLRRRPYIALPPHRESIGYLPVPDWKVVKEAGDQRYLVMVNFESAYAVLQKQPGLGRYCLLLAYIFDPDPSKSSKLEYQVLWLNGYPSSFYSPYMVVESTTPLKSGEDVRLDGMWQCSDTTVVEVSVENRDLEPFGSKGEEIFRGVAVHRIDSEPLEEWVKNNEEKARLMINAIRKKQADATRSKRR